MKTKDRFLIIFTLALLAAPVLTPGQAWAKKRDFRCVSSAEGTRTCVGKLPKAIYPQPIAILFPRASARRSPSVEPPNWVLYLHGNNTANKDLPTLLNHYRLADSLGRAKRQSILIFPLSRSTSAGGATADYREYLADPIRLHAFLAEIQSRLRADFGLRRFVHPERLHLMGHSGAYRTLAAILRTHARPTDTSAAYTIPLAASHASIAEVVLLDALYGELDAFTDFGRFALDDRLGIARLWSVYGSRGGLSRNTACLLQRLDSPLGVFGGCAAEWSQACNPSAALPLAPPDWACAPRFSASVSEYADARVGVLKSHVPHDSIPQDLLAPILARGRLSHRPCAGTEQADTGLACVDRWEGTALNAATGAPWSPYAMPSGVPLIARSAPGFVPQAYISANEAADACARSGKRLCRESEWQDACQGPEGRIYPYGNTYERGNCNDFRAVHPVIEFYGTDASWVWSYTSMNDPGINQQASTLALGGAQAACQNVFGISDLVGNVHEWVIPGPSSDGTTPRGAFRGGFYVDAEINGSGCLYRTTAHGPAYHDYSTG
ncbi:MAG: SUMF1/EgtB/PvdO family nonheme iron enzyme, partial [Bdellovibrionota bacterium]